MRRTVLLLTGLSAIALIASPAAVWAQDASPTLRGASSPTESQNIPAQAEEDADAPQGVAQLAVLGGDEAQTALEDNIIEDGGEVVRERYPNGNIKVERHVRMDAEENYRNDGAWKMWDEGGRLIVQGNFVQGQRQGDWIRSFRQGESERLTRTPFNQFTPPFISRATFKDDKLQGNWTIVDARKRKVTDWEFSEGLRHGVLTWWYPSGEKMQEIQYRDGLVDGKLRQWDSAGKPLAEVTYLQGRRVEVKVAKHDDGTIKTQGTYLLGKEALVAMDDWWTLKPAVYKVEGEDERHGVWISFHSNGKKKLEGNYEHGMPVGAFTWWHPNGQRATEGQYELGKQHGDWVWWHPNGMKAVRANFSGGVQAGRWTWWKDNGLVAQKASFGAGGNPIDASAIVRGTRDDTVDGPSILEDEQPSSSRRTAEVPDTEPGLLR
jgi:antitoxin component YwqK of YwqJK toxin-antitoxin module